MKLRFPYGNKPTPNFGTIPIISFWLSIQSSIGQESFLFLFDTGADVTSLPISAAKKLGIDLAGCPKQDMSGYEGKRISVFRSEIKISFNNLSFLIPCVFNPNEDSPILLGRAGIIARFNILLDGKNRQITFEEI